MSRTGAGGTRVADAGAVHREGILQDRAEVILPFHDREDVVVHVAEIAAQFDIHVALLPIITFFFLRDWDLIVERVASLIPRDHLPTVSRLARESMCQ